MTPLIVAGECRPALVHHGLGVQQAQNFIGDGLAQFEMSGKANAGGIDFAENIFVCAIGMIGVEDEISRPNQG